MKNKDIALFEQKFMRKTPLPEFKAGDSVCVYVKIAEGTEKDGTVKYRLQGFEGICIRYRKGTTNSTFAVRKISSGGIGVDRNFFTHSPTIDSVKVLSRGKVRKSRIYYIKKLKGKAARVANRFVGNDESTKTSAAQ